MVDYLEEGCTCGNGGNDQNRQKAAEAVQREPKRADQIEEVRQEPLMRKDAQGSSEGEEDDQGDVLRAPRGQPEQERGQGEQDE